jgi:hypothetical protein
LILLRRNIFPILIDSQIEEGWMRGSVFFVLLGFVLSAFNSADARAQAVAQISGSVADQSGAVLPGVEVTATQMDTGIARTTVSNETGTFIFPNLALGPYRLEAALPGFRTFAQSGILLQVNSNPVINVVLEVGQVTETVEVQANAAMVETRNQGIGRVVESQRILELPLNGRNAADLIVLAGAAVQTGTTSNRTFPGSPILSIAGAILSGTTYMLDGALNLDTYNGQSLPLPFPDALQEFKVETSGLSAQNGRANSVGAVTKGGTNEFHGSLFEFVRNDLFNATSYFAAVNPRTGDKVRNTLKRNQFGGTIGGPIVQNKLFFFGGYQGETRRQDPQDTQSFVPTAAMLAGDFTTFASAACNNGRTITLRAPFANNRIDPAQFNRSAVLIAAKLPKTDHPCGEIRYGSKISNDLSQYVGKVDYQYSANHSIFGRYLATTFDQPFPYSFEENVLTTPTAGYDNLAQSYALGSTYLVSPNTVNAFRLTVTRAAVNRTGPEFIHPSEVGINAFTYVPGYIRLSVSGGPTVGGETTAPATYRTTTYTLSDDVSWLRGNHQFAFGGNIAMTRSNGYSNSRAIGIYNFNGQETNLGMADFLLGRLESFRQGAPGAMNAQQWYFGLFVQDTWKARPNFTVNAGIRWDPYFPFEHTKGWVFNFDRDRFLAGVKSTRFRNAPAGLYFPGDPDFPGNTPVNDQWWHFGPRLGLAWDVNGDGRTSVRASYGISYEQVPIQWFSDTLTVSPFFSRITVTSPPGGLSDPWRGHVGGNPFPLTDFGPDAPFGQGVEILNRDPDQKTPYTQSWNLNIQKQLGTSWIASSSYIGSQSVHVWELGTLNPAIPMPGATTANTEARRKFTLERPVDGPYYGIVEEMESGDTQSYHGMLLSLERRASNVTVNSNYTWSHCIGGTGGSQDQGLSQGSGYPDPTNRDSNRGNCNSSRRHIFNLTSVAETPQFDNPTLRTIVTGWRLSGIYRLQSGSFLTVSSGRDTALNGIGGQRPNQVLASPYGDTSGRPGTNFLNSAAFAQAPNGTFGNVGRASIQGPKTWQFDASLSRSFSITENQRLEFRAEAYNVLNSFRPGNPATGFNNLATFGIIRTALDPRVMQFALKYVF